MIVTNDLSTVPAEGTDSVLALAASPCFVHDHTCFAARESGLYRSDDGGTNWRSMYEMLQLTTPLTTTSVAVSPDWETDRRVFVGVDGGILRSTDGGEQWSIMNMSTPPPLVSTVVVSPNFVVDGIVIAGTMEDGIFRSANRGDSWTPWNFGLLDLCVLVLAVSPNFAQDETLFAGTETGLFRSTNGGRAWREVPFPGEHAPVVSLALSPAYATDGIIFAGTEAAGLFCSRDSGDSWHQLSQDTITGTISSIAVSPHVAPQPQVLVLASSRLLISVDGGDAWSEQQVSRGVDQEMSIVFAPQGLGQGAPLLIGCSDGSVLHVS